MMSLSQASCFVGMRFVLIFSVVSSISTRTRAFQSTSTNNVMLQSISRPFLAGESLRTSPKNIFPSSKIHRSRLYEEIPKSIESPSINETSIETSELLVAEKKENVLPETTVKATVENEDSLKDMLKFALPALGIYLSNPMLSNIDNAFVGRTAGVSGLAALSPATICTDQMLYLFSFLGRATTGLVSHAFGVTKTSKKGNVEAACEAASAPLTMALTCGVALSIFYAFGTSNMLATLGVDPLIRPQAASYIHWRGAIAWAALAQSVALSVLMATRDSLTPLKIIGLSAALNVVGDFALCVWPMQWGCSGAAAATAAATLLSSGFMLRGLRKKGLLPKIRVPSWKELKGLMEFTGPLMLITLTRLGGFIAMQKRASTLGVAPLAAYQLGINLMIFFVLFGEPLSQLFQTKLPALIDENDRLSVVSTVKSVLTLAGITSVSIAAVAGLALYFGAPMFTQDVVVQGLAQKVAPTLFVTVLTTIFAIALDGAMLASRDFGFILSCGIGSFAAQLWLLPKCNSITAVFGTYTMRLGTYAFLAAGRMFLGKGALGRLLRGDLVSTEKAGAAAAIASP